MAEYVNRGPTILKVANNQTINRFKNDAAYLAYKEATGLNNYVPPPPPEDDTESGG